MESSEWQFHLALDAGGAGNAESRRAGDQILKQCGFSDPSFTVHYERAAMTQAQCRQQAVEFLAFSSSARQRPDAWNVWMCRHSKR